MCGCRRHHDMTSRCTCTCPSHEEIRAEQERARHEWKPDDLADINGSRAVRNKRNDGWIWNDGRNSPDSFTAPGARPLVVIDPEDREQVERLVSLQTSAEVGIGMSFTDALQAALREFANPTPPKPEEPKGLGAVVEDAKGRQWVHFGNGCWSKTVPNAGLDMKTWAQVDAAEVLSEGVQA